MGLRPRESGWDGGIRDCCGSIFLLVWLKSMGWPHAILGPFTPIGGTFMIGGWIRWVWVLLAETRG